ncbi:MAG: hypothetical protein ACI4PU_02105 [Intestinibacter sp.]
MNKRFDKKQKFNFIEKTVLSKKSIKVLSLALVAVCSINLTGCQLAKDDSQNLQNENLCGVFVRYCPDDDYSAELDYDKKYYITYDNTTKKYSVDGLEGYAIFLHKNGDTLEIVNDDVFRNVKMNVHVNSQNDDKGIYTTDDGDFYKTYEVEAPNDDPKIDSEEHQIEATMYLTKKIKGTIQFDPIIKDGDKYYIALGGQGIYLDGNNLTSCSTSESAQSTEKDSNRNEITKKFSYKISIEPADELKSIKIKEMNKNDAVVNTKQIVHTKDDYEFKIGKNTAYVIVEETCVDDDKKETIKRTVYDREQISNKKDETIDHPCNYAREDGVVIPKDLYILK